MSATDTPRPAAGPLPNAPPRADYGRGVFRRRIRLSGSPGAVRAELEDIYHGLCCTVRHDGRVITDISPEYPRIPLTTCNGAGAPLRALIGQPLDTPPEVLNRSAEPRRNCTHLLDITLLAIAHAQRGTALRQYDIAVSDEGDAPACAELVADGELVHRWYLRDSVFVAPEALRGQHALRGFSTWAPALYAGDALEAARVLQKGCFVAGMRRWDVAALGGQPAAQDTGMLGSCHSYSPGVVEHAVRIRGNERDFSDSAEALLRFL